MYSFTVRTLNAGPGQGAKPIESLHRGLEVVRAIEAASAATFTELQHETGLPKASLTRVLKTLQLAQWVHRNEVSGRYSIQHQARTPANRSFLLTRASELASGPREALLARVPWPTDLGVKDGNAMLSLDGAYAGHSFSANFRVLGARPSMLRSSLGRCYLAFCPDQERDQILNGLMRSRDPADQAGMRSAELKRLIDQVRAQGYATRDARHTSTDSPERFGALAVPVHMGERIAGALCVVWIPALASEAQIARDHLRDLQRLAGEIGVRWQGGLEANPSLR